MCERSHQGKDFPVFPMQIAHSYFKVLLTPAIHPMDIFVWGQGCFTTRHLKAEPKSKIKFKQHFLFNMPLLCF